MSDNKRSDGGEPSMEEILASIRKIITEDTHEGTDGSDQSEAADGGTRASKDRRAEAESDSAGPDAPEAAAPEADDEVLDLGAEAEPVEADGAQAGKDAEADVLDLTEEADAETAPAERADGREAERAGEPEPQPDPRADIGEWDPFRDPAAVDAPDEAPAAAAQGDTTSPSATAAQESEPMSAQDRSRSAGQRTVSEQTEEAAVDQLTTLARAANAADLGDDRPKSDVDRILETMVREALRPQLQEWLDQNLPQLVERIVRQEVRRMSRRAEDTVEDETPEA